MSNQQPAGNGERVTVAVTRNYAWANNAAVAVGLVVLAGVAAFGVANDDTVLAVGALSWVVALAVMAPILRSASDGQDTPAAHTLAHSIVMKVVTGVVVVSVICGVGAVMYWQGTGDSVGSWQAGAIALAAACAAIAVLVRIGSLLRNGAPAERTMTKRPQ